MLLCMGIETCVTIVPILKASKYRHLYCIVFALHLWGVSVTLIGSASHAGTSCTLDDSGVVKEFGIEVDDLIN